MYGMKTAPAWDIIDWEDYKKRIIEVGGELNAFKEDPDYIEPLEGQLCWDDFTLDD